MNNSPLYFYILNSRFQEKKYKIILNKLIERTDVIYNKYENDASNNILIRFVRSTTLYDINICKKILLKMKFKDLFRKNLKDYINGYTTDLSILEIIKYIGYSTSRYHCLMNIIDSILLQHKYNFCKALIQSHINYVLRNNINKNILPLQLYLYSGY